MNRDKELYQQLRSLSWDPLWRVEVPRFNAASERERFEKVAVIRAVGVVFDGADRDAVKSWLRELIKDPQEKIRRYAVAAIPKVGADEKDEPALLQLLRESQSERERNHVSEALGKIGGKDTLAKITGHAAQRVQARLVGSQLTPSSVFQDFGAIKIHFWCRAGLEQIVREEILELFPKKLRVESVSRALVTAKTLQPFSLADLWRLRCYGFVGFSLPVRSDPAEVIASHASLQILKTFTEGPVRYRLEFPGKGHQRAAVKTLAEKIHQRAPDLINSGADAPWTVTVHPKGIELRPRMSPDPRFAYRQGDVPAASHPPLAACMTRLAGQMQNAVVWDPFCGSGLELIERGLLGGVRKLIGTDRDVEAVETTKQNIASAFANIETQVVVADFREFDPGTVDAIITNPPLGKRVPVPNLRGLFEDLFAAAARHLRPGGCFVLANPMRNPLRHPQLHLKFSQFIDFGGFDCRLEKYVKGDSPLTRRHGMRGPARR